MEPLRLKPVYKDYIWGGEKLRIKYGKNTDITPLAESWELSCHHDGLSVIDGGKHDGKTLDCYIKENKNCLGTDCISDELPILIKLIDAQDDLSVQVHPDDEMAMKYENQNGKTEMWYVVDADENACITYGLKEDVSKQELESAIKETRLEALLNTVPSKKGDIFFVQAGTIHAIGKGNLIVEIQQNSNVTYRLYDYGRIGKDGKPRELHIEKGVVASDCKKVKPFEFPSFDDGTRVIGNCKYFKVLEICLQGEKILNADESSYHALVVTDGELKLNASKKEYIVRAGETLFIPANMGEYKICGKATVLITVNSNS